MHYFTEVGSSGRILGKSKNCFYKITTGKMPKVGPTRGPYVLDTHLVNC